MTRTSRLLPFAILLLSACTSYQGARPVEAIPLPSPERARFEVWSAGTGHQWHAVRVTTDSVSGIPWWNDPQCDSCRVTLARSAVDSVRSSAFDSGETGAMGLLLVPFVAIFIFVAGLPRT